MRNCTYLELDPKFNRLFEGNPGDMIVKTLTVTHYSAKFLALQNSPTWKSLDAPFIFYLLYFFLVYLYLIQSCSTVVNSIFLVFQTARKHLKYMTHF